jgi:integrase
MGAITSTDLKNLKRALDAMRQANGAPLKSRTKNGFLETVFCVIQHAVIVSDIAKDVTLGIKKYRVTDAKTPCPLTVPEFDSILVHVAPARRALFRTLLDSGMRISEALALEWEDLLEVEHGIVSIAVWGQEMTDAGKTGSAQRVTTIPTETFKSIPRLDEKRVFPFSYDTAAAEWRKAVHRAQSPAFATEFPALVKCPTIHDLRHTHAGFLLTECGFNLALVATRLGHKSIDVTKKYYGHLEKGQSHALGVIVAQAIPRGVVS